MSQQSDMRGRNVLVVGRARLRRSLEEHYSLGELRTLCFDLSVDHENLPGSTKEDTARELIAHLEHRGRLHQLVEMHAKLRPNAFSPPVGTPARIETTVRQFPDGRCELQIDEVPSLKIAANSVQEARVGLAALLWQKVEAGELLIVGCPQVSDVTETVIEVVSEPAKDPLRPKASRQPAYLSDTLRRLADFVEQWFAERAPPIEPWRGIGHVWRVYDYLEQLGEQKQGTGDDLTELEWEVLGAALWLRELKAAGGSQDVDNWLSSTPLRTIISSLLLMEPYGLAKVRSVITLRSYQIRLRLLGGLLLLADSLDIDSRTTAKPSPQADDPPPVATIEQCLRRYVAAVGVQSGQIGLVLSVPDMAYVPYLQAFFGGSLQRVFNAVAEALIEQGWYFWLTPSTTFLDQDLDLLPGAVRQELAREQTWLAWLRPLVESLASPKESRTHPRLTPLPLTGLRQPPMALTWHLPPLSAEESYEVKLVETETRTSARFQNLAEPQLTHFGAFKWQAGRQYRWSVYRRQRNRRRQEAYGVFQLVSPDVEAKVARAEAELGQTENAFSRRSLNRAMGLYEAVAVELREEIEQGITVVARLSARRELAELYDRLSSEAQRQQLDSLADEYSTLATIQYQYLRKSVSGQEDGVRR